jgi:hypothetical protein
MKDKRMAMSSDANEQTNRALGPMYAPVKDKNERFDST